MNTSTAETSSTLANNASIDEEQIDLDHLLVHLRKFYIQEYYGDHFHLIFVACFVFCVIGYLTNALNIVVFSRMSLSNSMNLFLLLLSISDIFLISTQFAHVAFYFEGFTMIPYYSHYLFFMISTFLESIFYNISNWMVAIIGIWRYVVITWPQKCSNWFKPIRVKILVLVVFIFSVLLACPMFLFFTYNTIQYRGYVFYDRTYTEFAMSNYRLPLKIYWGFLILRGVVPMIIMAITTGGLVYSLCKPNQSKANRSLSHKQNVMVTIMLIVLLVLFLLSNLPDSFMTLITVVSGGDSELQTRYRQATDIIRVFMLANNSFSFFIYIGLGQEFRRTFKNIFFSCCKTSTHNSSVTESVNGIAELGYDDTNKGVYQMKNVVT